MTLENNDTIATEANNPTYVGHSQNERIRELISAVFLQAFDDLKHPRSIYYISAKKLIISDKPKYKAWREKLCSLVGVDEVAMKKHGRAVIFMHRGL